MNVPVVPRCQVLPLPGHQVCWQIDGRERLRWHFATDVPRPFFYPLLGPSGVSLIRMGHPGAPNHDHHRGIWFAHHDVMGNDFWTEQTATRIRQLDWLCYEDSDREARMAMRLGWFDGHDPRPLLEQTVVVAVRPPAEDPDETLVEIQSTFVPAAAELELGQSNFGLLGVRVAKSISTQFGDGVIRDSQQREGEPAIFGQRARWMDYSGSVDQAGTQEGITYFDHPTNPDHPTAWHVRADGWMIASSCMNGPRLMTRQSPLVLRYLLHAHRGAVDAQRADTIAQQFRAAPPGRCRSRVAHTLPTNSLEHPLKEPTPQTASARTRSWRRGHVGRSRFALRPPDPLPTD